MPKTTVTYYRTILDSLDLYRVDDIINGGGPGCTETPAAALATHLREVNPAIRWNGNVLDLHELKSSPGVVMDAAKFVSRDGQANVFAQIQPWWPNHTSTTRSMVFMNPVTTRTTVVFVASSTGSQPQQVDSYGTVVLKEHTTTRRETTAYELATRDLPLTQPSLLRFMRTDGYYTPIDVPADPVSGFEQVEWNSQPWHDTTLPVPGTHAVDDFANPTYPAFMSAVWQGEGYARLVSLRAPE